VFILGTLYCVYEVVCYYVFRNDEDPLISSFLILWTVDSIVTGIQDTDRIGRVRFQRSLASREVGAVGEYIIIYNFS